jgi:diguanylate cyclase (GGDEF)-like protein
MHRRWRLFRQAEPLRGPRTALLLTGIFVALIVVTRLFCSDEAGDSSFFPADAALVAAILVLSPRLGFCTSLACFAANIALNALASDTLYDCLRLPALNVGLSYLTAFLTRSLCGGAIDLSRMRRLFTFTCICAVSAGVEAGLGVLGDPPDTRGELDNWLQWGLCDGLGLLLGTPGILLAIRSRDEDLTGDAGVAERWLLLSGTILLSLVAFRWTHTPLILLLYPALILIAFRAGPAWVLTAVLLVCLVASAMTVHGYGALVLISGAGRRMRGYVMQPYLLSLFLAALPANAALRERTRTARRMRSLKTAIEHDATHDALTGLANRALFRRRLAAALHADALRAVFFVDMDHFKMVNDTLGHQAGDGLLRQFSARLMQALPASALVARFGGDEFAILLRRDTPSVPIDAIAEAILTGARTPFDLAEGTAHVSASLGMAAMSATGAAEGELMRKADIALYAAKNAGRDCCRLFTDELDSQVRQRAQIENDLRAALNGAGGLTLNYQLKLDRSGTPRGVEALARWIHPLHGLILPLDFIKVAEETGLIQPLGDWVLREAVAFASRWPQLYVAVNVSPLQLRQPAFVTTTLQTLRAARVPPERVELEVTESVFLGDLAAATQSLTRLRDSGMRVALDDFGSGYSSMRHLQNFKADRLKIDRSFTGNLGLGTEPAAIVKAIVSLGHAMNLQVTAVGVETEAQRDLLIGAGIDDCRAACFIAQAMRKG